MSRRISWCCPTCDCHNLYEHSSNKGASMRDTCTSCGVAYIIQPDGTIDGPNEKVSFGDPEE
jgi:hypothetical protein